jgi:deoxyribonuclease-4
LAQKVDGILAVDHNVSIAKMRVREILNLLNSVERAALKKLLPPAKHLKEPSSECEKGKYPAALLSALNIADEGSGYANLGHIVEEMIGLPLHEITVDRLIQSVKRVMAPITEAAEIPLTRGSFEKAEAVAVAEGFTDALVAKVLKSKTTEVFLNHLRVTRGHLDGLMSGSGEPLLHEATLRSPCGTLEGHPDYSNSTQIFEVKMTGQLKENWQDFLFQVFAYSALAPDVAEIYLVLPLQEWIWGFNVSTWSNKERYRQFLVAAIDQRGAVLPAAHALIAEARIGAHMEKGLMDRKRVKTLADFIRALPSGVPSQIFLSGTQSSKIALKEADIVEAGVAVRETGVALYIHSPYLINLCASDLGIDDCHTSLLIRNLKIAVAIGARGVVVHVGKYTIQEPAEALAVMRANLVRAMEHATGDCPILLETPAGQGTELLCKMAEFNAFIADIGDPRVRCCVDTCHVFATGHQPLEYLRGYGTVDITKLIHFNDSATPCGSCVDRHAFVGLGHVGIGQLTEVARFAGAHAIPMVIED